MKRKRKTGIEENATRYRHPKVGMMNMAMMAWNKVPTVHHPCMTVLHMPRRVDGINSRNIANATWTPPEPNPTKNRVPDRRRMFVAKADSSPKMAINKLHRKMERFLPRRSPTKPHA
mmetsp:Transcript_12480/g.38070  ORF Transcript_12480/g.38070 Transcript_12480/m.38070 type:complete len:117 (+) Transcript_12480:2670-3020(+)